MKNARPPSGDRAPELTTGLPDRTYAHEDGSSWARACAELLPLPDRQCVVCAAPAVLGTPDGHRCPDHPPIWGQAVRWHGRTYGQCRAPRCYCGRCAFYPADSTDRREQPITPAVRAALAKLRQARGLADGM